MHRCRGLAFSHVALAMAVDATPLASEHNRAPCDADLGPMAASCSTSGHQSLLQLQRSSLVKNDTEWEYLPPRQAQAQKADPGDGAACMPSCRWSCSKPVCEEECEPFCKDPKCETRCANVELAGCQLECEQPDCVTVCPKFHCTKIGCPQCTTNCSEPLCRLRCPQKQNCTSMCESPVCKWKCKKPDLCPEPECKLECDVASKKCKGSIRTKLPALKKGEIKVASFVPPTSLLELSAGQLAAAGANAQRLEKPLVPTWVQSAGGGGFWELPAATY